MASLLHKALADAVRRGIITRNSTEQTEPPARDTRPRSVLTPDELQVYLVDARATALIYLWALHLTKAGTGMRFGELLGLRESDVDLDHGLIAVEQALKKPGRDARFGKLKTDRSKGTVTLPSVVVEAAGPESMNPRKPLSDLINYSLWAVSSAGRAPGF